jgi:transposase
MLHALKRSSADKATLRLAVQKLIHVYPTDAWTLAMLVSLLDQAQDVKTKYRQLVMLHSEWAIYNIMAINFVYVVSNQPTNTPPL